MARPELAVVRLLRTAPTVYRGADRGTRMQVVANTGEVIRCSDEFAERVMREFPGDWEFVSRTERVVETPIRRAPGETAPASPLCVRFFGKPWCSVRTCVQSIADGLLRLGYVVRTSEEKDRRDENQPEAEEVGLVWGLSRATTLGTWYRSCLDPVDGWVLSDGETQLRNSKVHLTFGLSHHSCDQLRGAGCANVEWLPLSVSPEVFRPDGPAEVPDEVLAESEWFGKKPRAGLKGRFLFLHQSAIQPRKGVEDLVRAYLAEFRADDPVALLLKAQHAIWGRDCRPAVRALCAEAGDHAPILYSWGQTTPEGMASLYCAADCYVSASRLEGWGYPPMEALACGTRVVASDASGHRDFLTHENAILIPTRNQRMSDAGPEAAHTSIATGIPEKVTWHRTEVADIRVALRQATTEGDEPRRKAREAGLRTVRWFSPEYCAGVAARAYCERGARLAVRAEVPAPPADTLVALAIPTLNYRDLLLAELESLRETRGVRFVVLVRDDGSDDGTAEAVREREWPFEVRLSRTAKRQGLPRAREALVKMAQKLDPAPTYFCYLDGDLTFPDPNWLAKLCALHVDGISGPKMLLPDGRVWSAGGTDLVGPQYRLGLRGFGEKDAPRWSVPIPVDHVPGACMFMRMDVWSRGMKGDLDYPVRYCDDTDLCLQATRILGEHCWFWPQVTLTHHAEMTRRRTPAQMEEHAEACAQARRRFIAKWFSKEEAAAVTAEPEGGPLVTVVMPLFNYADLMPRAVRSVQAQTYPNWELVIVDDGSTDGGLAVAEDLARRDDRIRVIAHGENRKLAAARNTGFAAARGRYIALLDADDEYLPHALSRLVAHAREHPEAALCYGNFQWEDGSAGSAEPYSWATLADHDYIPCQATLLDRYAAQAAFGNDPDLRHAEDWDYWLRVAALSGGAVEFVGPEPLYILHTHERQKTRDVAGMREHDAILRARAARYSDLPDPIRVAHVSFPLTPHGGQHVMRQIIEGTPGIEHSVYVPRLGGDLQPVIEALAPVFPLKALADARPDVLHVHDGLYPAVYDWLYAHQPYGPDPIPMLATQHGLADVPDFVRAYCRVVRTWDALDGVLSVPNGVDLPGKRAKPRKSGKPVVMTCARFAREKRPQLFVETCTELARRAPGRYRYLFVGGSTDEPLARRVQEAWAKLAEAEAAEWVPNAPRAELLRSLAAADVFLLCSDSETRPLVLMEAVTLGVPAIAANVGGVATIEGLAEVLPVDAKAPAWADAAQAHLGRVAPSLPESADGASMARRYGWLYRGLLVEQRRREFGA